VRFSIDTMPYLLGLHLLVAICVYGHQDFFVSGAWLRLQEIKVKNDGATKTVRFGSFQENGSIRSMVWRHFD
jgi:hypothetical protein